MENKLKRNIKDSLFVSFFGEEEIFPELYLECSQKKISPDEIERFDLSSDVFNRPLINDVTFITKDNKLLILAEHQSTLNPNMAIRLLQYYMELLKLWLDMNEEDLSKNMTVKIPEPELYVAYNGKLPYKEEYLTFQNDFLKITAKCVDINFDKLKDKGTDSRLAGYAFLIDRIEISRAKGMTREEALAEAVKECKETGYLKEYIERSDFVNALGLSYSYEDDLKYLGIEIGFKKGKAEGIAEGMAKANAEREKSDIAILVKMLKYTSPRRTEKDIIEDAKDLGFSDNIIKQARLQFEEMEKAKSAVSK